MTGLITFGNGLLRDIKAVKNGINMPGAMMLLKVMLTG